MEEIDVNPSAENYAKPLDVQRALQRVMLYGMLPAWLVPGALDYLFHRKTKIESTSGTHESLLHALQMTVIGIPTVMALLLQIDAPVIAVMAGSALFHEALTIWDVAYAQALRRPTPGEQHVHSFLEAMPFAALTIVMVLHPDQTRLVFRRSTWRKRPRLHLKEPPLDTRYLIAVFAAVGGLLVVPYAEELLRCYRVDRTFAPHTTAGDSPTRLT